MKADQQCGIILLLWFNRNGFHNQLGEACIPVRDETIIAMKQDAYFLQYPICKDGSIFL